MEWNKKTIGKNVFETYDKKYGKESDFQHAQKVLYSYPEIEKSLTEALSWLQVKPTDKILDIGVNNGYELKIFEKIIGKKFIQTELIGFDVSESALIEANIYWRKQRKTNFRFIKGDIRKFSGNEILSSKKYELKDKSVDTIIAMTSLQSTSLQKDFERLIKNLIAKTKLNCQILVAVPDCHVSDSGKVVREMFNANTQKIDKEADNVFIKKLIKELEKYGFEHNKIGKFFKFLYFYRGRYYHD